MTDKAHEILNAWFGDVGMADLPTSDRTNLWFGENFALKQNIVEEFRDAYQDAVDGKLSEWEQTPRGRLALIIMYDQFSRILHSQSELAFAYDQKAQHLALEGVEKEMDHSLTLIERVFFYMPIVHAENNQLQEKSLALYQNLVSLSMPETLQIYQLFLAYAYAHFKVVKEFGRFPQRNKMLKRESSEAEEVFLKAK